MEEVARTGGFILGVAVSPDNSWLAACDLKKRCLWHFDLKTWKLREFSTGAGGENLRIPNHLVFARDARLFVTDSGSSESACGKIFLYEPDTKGKGRVWHSGPFKFANGIVLSSNEDAIFVVSSLLPGVEKIELRPDGAAGKRRVWARLPKTVPDGLALGGDGTLYVTCYAPNRIYEISPNGVVSVLIDDWFAHTLSNPTNIAFFGPKLNQLLAANLGRWHLTQIDLRKRGHPLACQVPEARSNQMRRHSALHRSDIL